MGLTDEMLAWQTERLQELAVDSGEWVVQVRPELVVEVALRRGGRRRRATRAGWRCGSPGCCGTGRTSDRTRPDTVDAVRAIHG
jgi:DNA ligase-1